MRNIDNSDEMLSVQFSRDENASPGFSAYTQLCNFVEQMLNRKMKTFNFFLYPISWL